MFFFLTFSETHFQLFQPQPLNSLQNNLTWRESEDIVSALRPKGLRLRDAISAAHTANCSSRHVDRMGKPAPRTIRCWILFWRMCDALNSHRFVLIPRVPSRRHSCTHGGGWKEGNGTHTGDLSCLHRVQEENLSSVKSGGHNPVSQFEIRGFYFI